MASGDNIRMDEDDSIPQFVGKDEFQDAVDDFPFQDCDESCSEPFESHGSASISAGDPNPASEGESPSRDGLRRRRSNSRDKSFVSDANGKSSVVSENELSPGERRKRLSEKIRALAKKSEESGSSEITEISEVPGNILGAEDNDKKEERSAAQTNGANGGSREDLAREESSLRDTRGPDSSLILNLAGIVIKVIGFQIHMFLSIFMFPVRFVYYFYMFVFDPFGLWAHCKQCIFQKIKDILNIGFQFVSRSAYEWLKEHQAIWKLGLKCGWGLLWSAYVCAVLVGLLVSAFVMGGILIRVVVVEPVRIQRSLNFDYVEKSPTAFVPVTIKPELSHDVYIEGKAEFSQASELRVIPPNHKLKAAVSLTLPESDYNRNLGIFQVRVEFVAANGKTLASSKRPCMLHFRSLPIRLVLTLFKLAPILTGYTSETQTLKVNFRGFTEGDVPTAYLRVVIEQRAEFLPGSGIPEIYDASLTLESELPLLLNLLWFWKKTLFVWISMTIFGMELVFALLCCKPLVLPKITLRESSNSDTAQNERPRRR